MTGKMWRPKYLLIGQNIRVGDLVYVEKGTMYELEPGEKPTHRVTEIDERYHDQCTGNYWRVAYADKLP